MYQEFSDLPKVDQSLYPPIPPAPKGSVLRIFSSNVDLTDEDRWIISAFVTIAHRDGRWVYVSMDDILDIAKIIVNMRYQDKKQDWVESLLDAKRKLSYMKLLETVRVGDTQYILLDPVWLGRKIVNYSILWIDEGDQE